MNTPVTCCIVDDMPDAVNTIKTFITQSYGLTLTGSFTQAAEALAFIRQSPPQLLFCDINMPGLSGLEITKIIRTQQLPIQVIFTTASPEYAAESYRLYALDYLLKPIDKALFLEAVQKARVLLYPQSGDTAPMQTLVVKTQKGILQHLKIADILFVEMDKDYATIHLHNEKVMVLLSLKEIEYRLKGSGFIRTSKSHLVSGQYIDKTIGDNIHLRNGQQIPLSRSFKPAFLAHFK
jgi:two-component system, LytTR family, response regulator